MPTILIVDDEKNIRATLARGLRLEGYRTSEAANGRDALSVIEDGDVDAVLLDVQMPEMDGFAMLEDLRARGSTIPVIVLTAHGTIERAVRAVKLGAYDFVEKPPSMERILLAVGNALDRHRLAEENSRLAAETEAGRFRRDLYYRLLVVPITVPTLRERIEDVPQLARHFLEHACRRNRVRVKSIAPDGLARLTRHRWPGNIRELRNAMERVAILVSGDTVEAADLSFLAAGSQVAPEPPGEAGATPSDLASQVERFERAAVLTALTRNKWKMTQTAEELGLERSHLYKKLKALGIERPADD